MNKEQYLEEMSLITEKHNAILDSIDPNDQFEVIRKKYEEANVYLKKAAMVENLYDQYLETKAKKGDLSALWTLIKRYIHGEIEYLRLSYILWAEKRKLGI